MTGIDRYVAEYRYFVVDFLSNTVIAELPFKDVSYERSLNGAGAFSGSIPIIDKTSAYSLYDSTMPGKTALYVVRNNVCVWGGIVWSRSYSLSKRELSVNATEFSSYFYKRNVWKTFSHSYSASAVVSTPGTAAVAISSGQYGFSAGMPVYIEFYETSDKVYNGTRAILSSPSPTSTGFSVAITDSSSNPIPAGSYSSITVQVRVDTYDYARQLITNALSDFVNIRFPNDEITPGKTTFAVATNKALTSNYATLTIGSHSVQPGQGIVVSGVGSPFDGEHEVTSVTSTTVTYYASGSNVGSTAISPQTIDIMAKSASNPNGQLLPVAQGYALITTASAHGLNVGDYISVTGLDDASWPYSVFDGISIISAVPTSAQIKFSAKSQNKVEEEVSLSPLGTLYKVPYVSYGTYGPFPGNADFGLDFSTSSYSGEVHLQDNVVRGYELRSVGEELEEYSDALNGFEYRIDCEYDATTSSFKRTFVFVPIDFPPNDPPLGPGEASPLERYGAQNYVFEYPGNIMEMSISESAENSATRFFVLGNDSTLGNDASQPYSVATATDLLNDGWPLLDVDESKNNVFKEDELYDHAKRYLSEFRPPVGDFSITVNGSLQPVVGSYNPGDWCALIINDDFIRLRLASNLEPRDDIIVRKIDGFRVTVPNNPSFPESVDLTLIHEWEIDKVGE